MKFGKNCELYSLVTTSNELYSRKIKSLSSINFNPNKYLSTKLPRRDSNSYILIAKNILPIKLQGKIGILSESLFNTTLLLKINGSGFSFKLFYKSFTFSLINGFFSRHLCHNRLYFNFKCFN